MQQITLSIAANRNIVGVVKDEGYWKVERMSNGLGALIRRARDQVGWTQGELAERIGKKTSYVSRLETGAMKEMPTPEDINAIARVLPVGVAEMLSAAGYDLDAVVSADDALYARIDAALGPVLDRPEVVEAILQNMRHTVEMWQAFNPLPPSPPPPDAPAGEPTEESDGSSPAPPAS